MRAICCRDSINRESIDKMEHWGYMQPVVLMAQTHFGDGTDGMLADNGIRQSNAFWFSRSPTGKIYLVRVFRMKWR